MATSDQTVKVILQGEDKTGPAFKSASKSTSILQKDVSGLAKVLGGAVVAGGAALTAFLYSAAKGAADAQASLVRVTTTLESMGAAAVKNKDAILEAANAAVKLGFDDEAAAESITRFYQATNDLTKAQELTSLAMDLARAKQLDLATATGLVNQVLAGNGRALKQYQIDLKETNDPLLALGELHDKVKGQAEAFAGTFQGQMAIINESVNNMKDTIGAALLEAITPFVKELTVWASNPDVQKKVKEIATTVGEFAKVAIPVAIEAIKIWISVFNGVVEVLGTIIYNIERAISAITRFKDAVGGVIDKAGKATGNAISTVVQTVTGKRAEGGPVSARGSYIVGERGPEIFTPSTSGFITPNGGRSITVNITGNMLLDGFAAEKIGDLIISRLKLSSQV